MIRFVVNLTFPIKRKYLDRNIYTIALRFGSTPSQPAEMVLATNTEWTIVASVGCENDDGGCTQGAYDREKSISEKENSLPVYALINVSQNSYKLLIRSATLFNLQART